MRGAVRLGIAWALLAACGGEGGEPVAGEVDVTSRPLSIYAVNEPLRSFAAHIGDASVQVVFPAPAGVDPASWSPTPEVVAAYQAADLILLQGAGYARWVERASLPLVRLVDTSEGFADRLIPLEDGVTHAHGPQGSHTHEGWAGASWLDPTLAVEQARAVADALAEARPEAASAFRERFEALSQELVALDDRLGAVARAWGERPLLFSHPVYPYLIRRYRLAAHSLHWEPHEDPGAREWRALERLLAEHPAGWMLWEGEPLETTRHRLEALGVRSVVFDPCASTSARGDFVGCMRGNVSRLEAALLPPEAAAARREPGS